MGVTLRPATVSKTGVAVASFGLIDRRTGRKVERHLPHAERDYGKIDMLSAQGQAVLRKFARHADERLG